MECDAIANRILVALFVQPRRNLVDREGAHLRGGKFQRQWNPVQLLTNLHDRHRRRHCHPALFVTVTWVNVITEENAKIPLPLAPVMPRWVSLLPPLPARLELMVLLAMLTAAPWRYMPPPSSAPAGVGPPPQPPLLFPYPAPVMFADVERIIEQARPQIEPVPG